MISHPYSDGVKAYHKAANDFDYFAINALASIPEILKKIPRAAAIERANAFLVNRTSPTSLQAWFGKRPTGRPTLDATSGDVEIGAQLVYSLGANGLAVAIIYPASSGGATAREGRIGFRRLLTYAFNMLTKKIEIVLFLAIGLVMTGHSVMTPVMMVLMLFTNDVLAMSLTTDRASPSPSPSIWRMRNVTGAAIVLGACKLAFSTAMLAMGKYQFGLGPMTLQTFAFVTLLFGSQGLIYVLRERHHIWSSTPSKWVFASSVVDISIVAVLALSGTLMGPLPWQLLLVVSVATAAFALILDQIKRLVTAALRIE